jgi:hypothetical protein
VLLGVLGGLPIALCLYAYAPNLVLGVAAIVVVGFLYLGALSSFTTIAQLRAPDHLRGRVLSVLMFLLGALYPLGSVLQGAIADRVGLRATTAGAALLMAAVLLAVRRARPGVVNTLEQPVGDPLAAAIPPPDHQRVPATRRAGAPRAMSRRST